MTFTGIVIIALCAVIALQAVFHYAERRDLYNRIMCRDLTEYRSDSGKNPKSSLNARHDEIMKKWRDANG